MVKKIYQEFSETLEWHRRKKNLLRKQFELLAEACKKIASKDVRQETIYYYSKEMRRLSYLDCKIGFWILVFFVSAYFFISIIVHIKNLFR